MEAGRRSYVERLVSDVDGILRLEPCWVARDLVPPGRRLGLADEAYDLGERGFICERWLASTTRASNAIGPADEGLSFLAGTDERMTLQAAVEAAPQAFMGSEYAAAHDGLGRLAKIFDYAERLPYHLHHRLEHARRVGQKPKEEAYYFPEGFEPGRHPESFLGLHPSFGDVLTHDVLLPYLVAWDSDRILKHARGYLQVPDEGFHIPAGVLHAPGTAVTIELQEDSDVFAMLQALNAGRIISKRLLFKDVTAADEREFGERFILELIDWDLNADPYFYENRHLKPLSREATRQPGGEETWIFYNTSRFSGTKLVIRPGSSYHTVDPGPYTVLVLRGAGTFATLPIRGGDAWADELLVVSDRARTGVEIRNTSAVDELVLIKFFGPDINVDVPLIQPETRAGRTTESGPLPAEP